jgi:pimeloyl-ACP methyl ester carboxylesterase
MPLDTSSFPAYLRSLNITTPVTARGGQMIPGPPVPFFELALRLGLGALILDTPQNRSILARINVPPETLAYVSPRLRSRHQWRAEWEALAGPHLAAADGAAAKDDRENAVREIRAALALLVVAYSGDGYYIHLPMRDRREIMPTLQRLYAMLNTMTGERVERVSFDHPRGSTAGLLHFPKGNSESAGGAKRYPVLLAIHPLASDKESFDHALGLFREAGYATFCIDLPAHGDSFDGPRLKPDDELVGAAAVEALAAHPEIDPDRLGAMGGSLGAFYALRTAALSPRVKACLAFASPFDAGKGLPESVPGIQEHFAHVIGAPTIKESFILAKPFHLRDVLGNIKCPVALVCGTQDHICDFTASYQIARRVRGPLSVFPLVGADHEVSSPSTPELAGAGVGWLRGVL